MSKKKLPIGKFQFIYLLIDDNAIAIDSALNGDAKEGIVPDFVVVRASGGTQGSATSHGSEKSGGSRNHKELLHCFAPCLLASCTVIVHFKRINTVAELQLHSLY